MAYPGRGGAGRGVAALSGLDVASGRGLAAQRRSGAERQGTRGYRSCTKRRGASSCCPVTITPLVPVVHLQLAACSAAALAAPVLWACTAHRTPHAYSTLMSNLNINYYNYTIKTTTSIAQPWCNGTSAELWVERSMVRNSCCCLSLDSKSNSDR